jgi:hypothetical protein
LTYTGHLWSVVGTALTLVRQYFDTTDVEALLYRR